jgi:hypothetical protein
MGKETIVGVLIIIFLFLGLTGIIASKVEVTLPYSTETTSVLDVIWDNVADFLSPF